MSRQNRITVKEFDALVESGVDLSEHLDFENATKRVNVDFPAWMLEALDKHASRMQIPRQALIKLWLDEKLKDQLAAG